MLSVCCPRHLWNQKRDYEDILWFFSRSFIVSAFMFKSKIHLELMFVFGSVIDWDLFFHTDIQLSQRCFFFGKNLSCSVALVPLLKISGHISMSVYAHLFCSVDLFFDIPVTIPDCSDCYSFAVVLKSSSMPTPSFASPPTIVFFFLGPLYLHIHFRISFFMSRKCLLEIWLGLHSV